MYANLYKSCSIKQIIFSKYGTNLKTTMSHRRLRISGLLILYFLFAFSIKIIDIIITSVYPYSLYCVTRTSANGSAVYWSRDFRLYQNCIYEFSFNFDTVLYQFLKTGTLDRYFMRIVKSLRFSGFIIYPLPAVPLTTCDFKKQSNLTF